MDFVNRSNQHHQAAQTSVSHSVRRGRGSGFLHFGSALLLFSIAILLAALALSFVFSTSVKSEKELVDKSKYQVVVLGSQSLVYYGNVTNINRDYVTLSNVWYVTPQQLQNNQGQATQTNYSLVKQGCELYGPSDPMVIRRDNVVFWQNLKSDSKVSQSISDTIKKYPDGAKDCYAAAGNTKSQ